VKALPLRRLKKVLALPCFPLALPFSKYCTVPKQAFKYEKIVLYIAVSMVTLLCSEPMDNMCRKKRNKAKLFK
jgi:hypothetical protein